MKKRLQIALSDEAWSAVQALTTEANENFDVGSITYSDAINEMVLSSRVDIKALQLKHTNFRRSLRVMAAKDGVDIDAVIKSLMELKAKTLRKKSSVTTDEAV